MQFKILRPLYFFFCPNELIPDIPIYHHIISEQGLVLVL